MTYVKRAKSGGVEITSAALTLSGLEEQEFLEVQTLNGAVVLFSADAERHELAGIVNELVRLAEAIITDVLDEEEAEQEIDSVPFPKAILENAGLNGNEYHVFSDKGNVMIVDKNQDFGLPPESRECLHAHGVTPEHFDCLVNQNAVRLVNKAEVGDITLGRLFIVHPLVFEHCSQKVGLALSDPAQKEPVAQKVEPELFCRSVGDIALICIAPLSGRLLGLNHADFHTERLVDRPHQFGVARRQVVVNRCEHRPFSA